MLQTMATPGERTRRLGRPKVVLYNPYSVFYTMPLALIAVGSHLDPDRYEVVIVDGRLEDNPLEAVLAHTPEAVCVGVTVLTGAPIRDAIRISRGVKAIHPDLPVVWGGWHPSMFGRECLAESSVDVTVQGQGEATFADIVHRLASRQTLDSCAGCVYRDPDGRLRENPRRPLLPLDGFRPHDYGLIPVERYFALKGKRQLDYISSQGCQFRCAFCADPFVYSREWVGLDPARVGREIEQLWQRYRFSDVNFQDETFFTRRTRAETIAGEIRGRGVRTTWAATMRADQGARLEEEALARCRASGLRRVLVGVESGSEEMLRRIRKDIHLDQVYATANAIRRVRIAGTFPFIVGFPEESEESVTASLAVAKRLRRMSPDFQTPFFYFKPYPGSELTTAAVARGYQLPSTLEEWTAFDYVGSVGGPWVSPDKFRLIERFKFYQQIAFDRERWWTAPLQRFARWRCAHDAYGLPLEMRLCRLLWPSPALS